jgi:gluconokinase
MLSDRTLASTPRILLIMGVAGSGKSTLGHRAAAALGWPYFEGDDFHSAANKDKMARGIPLDDADRAPWLAAIRAQMDEVRRGGGQAVFSCSALKESYRAVLLGDAADVALVYLSGDFETLRARLAGRQGHFMKADMLQSQLTALEPPQGAFALDIRLSPDELLRSVLARVRG